MKKYDVIVKILSKCVFEVDANNVEEAVDITEKVIKESELLELIQKNKKIYYDATETDSNEKNECESCDYCCPECGCCLYEEE